jgi:hypothetical protein
MRNPARASRAVRKGGRLVCGAAAPAARPAMPPTTWTTAEDLVQRSALWCRLASSSRRCMYRRLAQPRAISPPAAMSRCRAVPDSLRSARDGFPARRDFLPSRGVRAPRAPGQSPPVRIAPVRGVGRENPRFQVRLVSACRHLLSPLPIIGRARVLFGPFWAAQARQEAAMSSASRQNVFRRILPDDVFGLFVDQGAHTKG